MLWRNLHLIVGTLGLVLFALQGQYMAHVLEVTNLADAPRMLYRSAHIYFMTACAMNLCIGYYQSENVQASWQERLVSLLILLAPGLLLLSFFLESNTQSLERPIITVALYALFGSGAILATSAIVKRIRTK